MLCIPPLNASDHQGGYWSISPREHGVLFSCRGSKPHSLSTMFFCTGSSAVAETAHLVNLLAPRINLQGAQSAVVFFERKDGSSTIEATHGVDGYDHVLRSTPPRASGVTGDGAEGRPMLNSVLDVPEPINGDRAIGEP
jgi:hypothetical protein